MSQIKSLYQSELEKDQGEWIKIAKGYIINLEKAYKLSCDTNKNLEKIGEIMSATIENIKPAWLRRVVLVVLALPILILGCLWYGGKAAGETAVDWFDGCLTAWRGRS